MGPKRAFFLYLARIQYDICIPMCCDLDAGSRSHAYLDLLLYDRRLNELSLFDRSK